jgi:hypothetical protein
MSFCGQAPKGYADALRKAGARLFQREKTWTLRIGKKETKPVVNYDMM